jgi:hypothetical protein
MTQNKREPTLNLATVILKNTLASQNVSAMWVAYPSCQKLVTHGQHRLNYLSSSSDNANIKYSSLSHMSNIRALEK